MNDKMANKDPTAPQDSLPELLGQLVKSFVTVVHEEIELIIQRVREKERVVRGGILLFATGLAIGFAAFMSLCAALIMGLISYMSPFVAALVIGLAVGFVGVIVAFIGYGQLKKEIDNP